MMAINSFNLTQKKKTLSPTNHYSENSIHILNHIINLLPLMMISPMILIDLVAVRSNFDHSNCNPKTTNLYLFKSQGDNFCS